MNQQQTCLFILRSQPISLCVAPRPWPILWSWWTVLGASAASTSGWCECSWRTWWELSTSASTRPEWVSGRQFPLYLKQTPIQLSENLMMSSITVFFTRSGPVQWWSENWVAPKLLFHQRRSPGRSQEPALQGRKYTHRYLTHSAGSFIMYPKLEHGKYSTFKWKNCQLQTRLHW